MIDKVLGRLEEKTQKIKQKKEYFMTKPTVCVIGQVSVGKSSFLNLLLGMDIFKSSIEETTNKITKIEEDDGFLVQYELQEGEFKLKKKYSKGTGDLIGSDFLTFLNIVDVPGYNKSFDDEIENYIIEGEYDIVLYILDISKGLSKTDQKLLDLLKEREPYILFVLNKIDIYKDEDKEDFKECINIVKQNIEEIYPKSKILGYVPSSATKFRKNKKFVKFLQGIITIASYVSTFRSNLDIIRNSLIDYLVLTMIELEERDQYYIDFYLAELKNRLDKASNVDIVMNGENTIKSIIEDVNNKVGDEIRRDIIITSKTLNEEINLAIKEIKDMSISYIEIIDLNLTHNFSQVNLIREVSNTIQVGYSDEIFDEFLKGIFISIGGGILARLALGALIPGIGTLVFLGSIIYTIWNLDKKANEVKSKVYYEVSEKVPSIIRSSWGSICEEMKEYYITQIELITNNENIDEFLDKLISGTYNMNEELSNFIIDNIEKLVR
ncbi:dynamin family protein [Hydrogenobacter thermophilus]|uniref:dynamin family protein n=1 Tax=Hydrogenobacter thermophilus TaxID=940 RepID=UPI0030F90E09